MTPNGPTFKNSTFHFLLSIESFSVYRAFTVHSSLEKSSWQSVHIDCPPIAMSSNAALRCASRRYCKFPGVTVTQKHRCNSCKNYMHATCGEEYDFSANQVKRLKVRFVLLA